MAGELLFRVLDRRALEARSQPGAASIVDENSMFLDGGGWSMTEPAGDRYVCIDGPRFAEDAPWLYQAHDTFTEVVISGAETATLLVPRNLVTAWRRRLETLPPNGAVASNSPEVRDALIALMDLALGDEALELTVQSLL